VPRLSPNPTAGVLVSSWQTTWVGLLALFVQLVGLAWYLFSVRRLSARGQHWSPWVTTSFVLGVAVTAYAYEGGIAHYERGNFTAHVVQLLLLSFVGPPLLAGGCPFRLALLSGTGKPTAGLVALMHARLARLVAHPLTALLVLSVTLYAYFLSPLYGISERHPVFLAYVHLQFFVGGSLFCWSLVGRDASPRPASFGWRFSLVLASIPLVGFCGLEVASVKSPLFAAGNTLADTHQGGNVLWALMTVLAVAALGYLFVEWAREEERRALRADRQLDAALAATRAARLGATEDGQAWQGTTPHQDPT
jgi:cytochrome c oxidase assembly factor CtaG